MCSTTTVNHGRAATTTATAAPITSIHPDIIQSHILTRLDGTTLASASCASSQLNSICTDDHLWQNICNATWPSTADPTVRSAISSFFPSAHRSLFSYSFPAPRCHVSTDPCTFPNPSELISAVDIFHDDKLIYSRVVKTETHSDWFLRSPFRLDLLGRKETVKTSIAFDAEEGACVSRAAEGIRVSWLLIDPARGRAVNVATSAAVEARRHWLTDDVQLRYSTVVAAADGEMVQCGVVVREVSLQVEDMEGKILAGSDSLAVLGLVMEGRRWKIGVETEKEIYEMFVRRKIWFGERKMRRERRLDMAFMAAGVSILVAVWVFLLSR